MFSGACGYFAYPEVTILNVEERIMTRLSIAFVEDSEFLPIFDYHIKKIMESGLLAQMKHVYLEAGKLEPLNEALKDIAEAAHPLGYSNLLFPALLLIGGICLGLLLLLLEKFVKIILKSNLDRPTFGRMKYY